MGITKEVEIIAFHERWWYSENTWVKKQEKKYIIKGEYMYVRS